MFPLEQAFKIAILPGFSSRIGFAPFDNPEIAIVVMVENGGHGNYTAEVVRDIMAEYFGMNTQNVEESMEATPYVEIMR